MPFEQLGKEDCRVARHRAEWGHVEEMCICNNIHKGRCNPAKGIIEEEEQNSKI